MIQEYYDNVWARKLELPQYATLESRWRSRWDFAVHEIVPGSKVLDAACGDGVLGEMLVREKHCEVVGLEISGKARQRAEERGLKVVECDIAEETFPAEENSFDYVTLLCCLEHVFDPGHTLREAGRVLRPGGRVLVTLPNAVQLRFRFDFLRGKLSKDLLHTNDGEGIHVRFFDYNQDFERLVRTEAPQLELVRKIPTLKNPLAYGTVRRALLSSGLRIWPNLFAEYGNYVLVKCRAKSRC